MLFMSTMPEGRWREPARGDVGILKCEIGGERRRPVFFSAVHVPDYRQAEGRNCLPVDFESISAASTAVPPAPPSAPLRVCVSVGASSP